MTEIIKNNKAGHVIWITGLSGAGKSVLAAALVKRLRMFACSHVRMFDNEILVLDGDELREVFGVNSINFENCNRDKRITLAIRYAYLCIFLAKPGFTVLIATIFLFKKFHV